MEEITPKVEVKIRSREFVKPSVPTPPHLQNFELSYIDQILPLVPPFLSTGLVFYTAATPNTQLPLHITRLKSSLSKALSKFYPLAGRVKQTTITCNDHGIPFVETEVDCSLSTILNSSHKLDIVTKFLPPRESLGITKGSKRFVGVINLAIQVNVFTCGGLAIGWYDIHKVMDGTSSATFFKYWAALASNHNSNVLVQPDFFSTTTAFPPSPKAKLLPSVGSCEDCALPSPIVVNSFIFSNVAINKLKARAASKLVPNPTSYEALAGFIWEQLLVVSNMRLSDNECSTDTVLQVTVDMRPSLNPPLPRGSMGNLVNTAIAKANKWTRLPELVAEIHASVLHMKNEIRENYHGEKGAEAVRASWDKLITTLGYYEERAYKVVSWCKLGFNNLDFGFGKPKWMVPTDGIMSPFHRNLIILNNSYAGDGVEGWLFLEKKDAEILESNQEFLALCSPAYYNMTSDHVCQNSVCEI